MSNTFWFNLVDLGPTYVDQFFLLRMGLFWSVISLTRSRFVRIHSCEKKIWANSWRKELRLHCIPWYFCKLEFVCIVWGIPQPSKIWSSIITQNIIMDEMNSRTIAHQCRASSLDQHPSKIKYIILSRNYGKCLVLRTKLTQVQTVSYRCIDGPSQPRELLTCAWLLRVHVGSASLNKSWGILVWSRVIFGRRCIWLVTNDVTDNYGVKLTSRHLILFHRWDKSVALPGQRTNLSWVDHDSQGSMKSRDCKASQLVNLWHLQSINSDRLHYGSFSLHERIHQMSLSFYSKSYIIVRWL